MPIKQELIILALDFDGCISEPGSENHFILYATESIKKKIQACQNINEQSNSTRLLFVFQVFSNRQYMHMDLENGARHDWRLAANIVPRICETVKTIVNSDLKPIKTQISTNLFANQINNVSYDICFCPILMQDFAYNINAPIIIGRAHKEIIDAFADVKPCDPNDFRNEFEPRIDKYYQVSYFKSMDEQYWKQYKVPPEMRTKQVFFGDEYKRLLLFLQLHYADLFIDECKYFLPNATRPSIELNIYDDRIDILNKLDEQSRAYFLFGWIPNNDSITINLYQYTIHERRMELPTYKTHHLNSTMYGSRKYTLQQIDNVIKNAITNFYTKTNDGFTHPKRHEHGVEQKPLKLNQPVAGCKSYQPEIIDAIYSQGSEQ